MTRVVSVLVALLGLLAAACGDSDEGDAAIAGRRVAIDMVDTAFRPRSLEVEAGESIRLVFHNKGKAAHDAFIGDRQAQADHERKMREAEDSGHGGHGGDDEATLTVDPGDTAELVYTFDRAGTYEIGCHQPGHYAAGMKVTVQAG